MRRLTFLVLILAGIYSGYWFVGAQAVERAAAHGIATLRDQGWQVSYDDLNTRGFPSRFDTTVTDVKLTRADGLLGWSAPFAQLFALSYQPNKVIAILPRQQSVTLQGQRILVESEDLRASVGAGVSTDMPLETATMEAGATTLTSEFGWSAGVDRMLAAVRVQEDGGNLYDVYLDTDQIALPQALLDVLQLENGQVEGVVLDANVGLDRPLDRHIAPDALPALRSLKLNRFELRYDPVVIRADGSLQIDELGVPSGRIDLETTEWRVVVEMLVNMGVIDSGVSGTVERVAATLAQGEDSLKIPLSFQNGFVSLGPLPLGQAPRLR